MKYLLVLALAGAAFWLWRHGREAEKRDAAGARSNRSQSAAKEAEITEMVACDVCQVHLPRSEALIGSRGIYCSDAHRRQAGG
ncbi:MAG: PP0621 family protein [Polaromonas sp.]|nr:PP0621 family protein [Polaromonas sp.]